MTNPVIGWFHLMRTYNEDTVMTITDLESMWLTTYSGWKEMHTTTDSDFLVLSFKIPNNIYYII